MNPAKSLLHSRKFWLLILDVVITLTLYFGGKYLGSSAFEDLKTVIVSLQVVFAAIIGAIAVEDFAVKSYEGRAKLK